MALLELGSLRFDAELVVFDKDGTLLDFEFMWGRLVVAWVDHLAADQELRPAGGGEALRVALFCAVGYDLQQQRTRPDGPLAIATTAQLQDVAAAVLYQHGVSWPRALDSARAAYDRAIVDLPLAETIRPAGDVAALFGQLQAAGVRVAVVTTDHRAETEETLRLMGVTRWVDDLVCGDDGVPSKPAPDMLLVACQRLGVEPVRAAVVGDTLGDLLMAGRAGAGCRVAVLTGAGERESLGPYADVVLDSIDGIRVVNQ